MLYLTRKIGESVIINDDIEVSVIDIRGKSIKLGFTWRRLIPTKLITLTSAPDM